jgi:hypothetical protein
MAFFRTERQVSALRSPGYHSSLWRRRAASGANIASARGIYIRRLDVEMERGPAQRNGRAGPLRGINCPKSDVRRGTAVNRLRSDRSSTSHNPLCTTAVASPRAALFRWFTLSDGGFFNIRTRQRQPPDLRVRPVTRRARGRLRQTVAPGPQRCPSPGPRPPSDATAHARARNRAHARRSTADPVDRGLCPVPMTGGVPPMCAAAVQREREGWVSPPAVIAQC